jgi:hypothetical protein
VRKTKMGWSLSLQKWMRFFKLGEDEWQEARREPHPATRHERPDWIHQSAWSLHFWGVNRKTHGNSNTGNGISKARMPLEAVPRNARYSACGIAGTIPSSELLPSNSLLGVFTARNRR